MIRRFATVTALLGAAALTACAPTSRFEWGAYEHALYSYSENPENRGVYKEALERAIARGRSRNAVAPGLLAELGYLYLEEGNTVEAVKYFREERSLFPESAILMDRVIMQSGGSAPASNGQD